MKSFVKVGFSLTLLLIVGLASAYPQSIENEVFRPWVEYRNGEISVAFRQVPVEFAVQAIHETTGFQIIVPPEASGKTISLRLRGLPLESAMRLLLSSVGFSSFALTYDRNGRPLRAIVLEARPNIGDSTDPGQKPATETLELTPEERKQLAESLTLWSDLKNEARGRIEDRLRTMPPSEGREALLQEYARKILGIID